MQILSVKLAPQVSPPAFYSGSYSSVVSRTYTNSKQNQRNDQRKYSMIKEHHKQNTHLSVQGKPQPTHQAVQQPTKRVTQRPATHSQADRIVVGTGPNSSLRAVQTTRSSNTSNRTCTGLFVSRIAPCHTANQLQTYVWQQSGYKVKAEKINSRSSTHSSFFIRCDKKLRDSLHDANVWPQGAFVKLYFD